MFCTIFIPFRINLIRPMSHVPTRGPESAAVRVTNHRLMTPAKICYCHMRLVAAVVGEMFLMVLQFD